METISNNILTARLIDEGNDYSLPKSQISLNEKTTETIVVGATLEICIKVYDFYLLFMTDDIPNEDMLHIYLLNQEAVLLDSVTLGAPYSTGTFELLEFVEPNTVAFNFIGSTIWKVHILNKKRFHAPFISDPKGVSRSIGFSSYLQVEGNPVAESN